MSADAVPGLVTEPDAESIEPLLRTAMGMVIMEFYSPDCPVCQTIAPIIAGMAKEMTGKVVFSRLNTDAYPDTSVRLGGPRDAYLHLLLRRSAGPGLGRLRIRSGD